jgi:hypothetical protein
MKAYDMSEDETLEGIKESLEPKPALVERIQKQLDAEKTTGEKYRSQLDQLTGLTKAVADQKLTNLQLLNEISTKLSELLSMELQQSEEEGGLIREALELLVARLKKR